MFNCTCSRSTIYKLVARRIKRTGIFSYLSTNTLTLRAILSPKPQSSSPHTTLIFTLLFFSSCFLFLTHLYLGFNSMKLSQTWLTNVIFKSISKVSKHSISISHNFIIKSSFYHAKRLVLYIFFINSCICSKLNFLFRKLS